MSAASEARGKGFMVPADIDLELPIDWRAMFVKYVGIVRECEGADFLYPSDQEIDYEFRWTPAEWAAIREAVPDA